MLNTDAVDMPHHRKPNSAAKCCVADPEQGLIFSAIIVRTSKEYHTDTFMTDDLPLPIHFRTGPSTSNYLSSGEHSEKAVDVP